MLLKTSLDLNRSRNVTVLNRDCTFFFPFSSYAQEQLAMSHGTQCGFCSPGFVMAMYSLLQDKPHPTTRQMESALSGNICRCTGYRPILEGFGAFCKDSKNVLQSVPDIEVSLKCCNPISIFTVINSYSNKQLQ